MKVTYRYIITQLLKTNDKEKVPKSVRENDSFKMTHTKKAASRGHGKVYPRKAPWSLAITSPQWRALPVAHFPNLNSLLDFPSGSDDKESACNAGSIPGLGRSPGEGNGNPLQYSCLEKSHGQRSMVGHNPWDCKESDKTECMQMHTQTHTHLRI